MDLLDQADYTIHSLWPKPALQMSQPYAQHPDPTAPLVVQSSLPTDPSSSQNSRPISPLPDRELGSLGVGQDQDDLVVPQSLLFQNQGRHGQNQELGSRRVHPWGDGRVPYHLDDGYVCLCDPKNLMAQEWSEADPNLLVAVALFRSDD